MNSKNSHKPWITYCPYDFNCSFIQLLSIFRFSFVRRLSAIHPVLQLNKKNGKYYYKKHNIRVYTILYYMSYSRCSITFFFLPNFYWKFGENVKGAIAVWRGGIRTKHDKTFRSRKTWYKEYLGYDSEQ